MFVYFLFCLWVCFVFVFLFFLGRVGGWGGGGGAKRGADLHVEGLEDGIAMLFIYPEVATFLQ